uniref:Odorant receptor n=1 Tax=Sirex nitobei TaxID=1602346 RepID=A0A857N3D7_9HYME|nr:odorant receptor 13 [Sirex nitobei]
MPRTVVRICGWSSVDYREQKSKIDEFGGKEIGSAMRLKVTPEAALNFTKISVRTICSWPPPPDATKLQIILFEVFWWISHLFLVLLALPLMLAVYEYRRNPSILTKTLCEVSAIAQTAIKMAICRGQYNRFQVLFSEMETFLKHANSHERTVLQRYVDKVAIFHAFITISAYLTAFAFACGPLVLSQPFPSEATYPFPIDSRFVKIILLVLQEVAIIQAGAGVAVDCQAAVLIWFTVARFELLALKMKKVESEHELYGYLLEHQKLLKYANEMRLAVRFVAFAAIALTTVGVTCGGLQLISHQPLSVKGQFCILILTAALELFAYAWPADNLISASESIGRAAYNSPWIGKSSKMLTSLLILFRRSNEPLVISINGIVPAVSLNFYGDFLSSAFAYFTTLRVLVGE